MMCLKVFSLKNSNFKNPISALFKQTMITIFGFLDSFLRPILEKKIFEKKILNFHVKKEKQEEKQEEKEEEKEEEKQEENLDEIEEIEENSNLNPKENLIFLQEKYKDEKYLAEIEEIKINPEDIDISELTQFEIYQSSLLVFKNLILIAEGKKKDWISSNIYSKCLGFELLSGVVCQSGWVIKYLPDFTDLIKTDLHKILKKNFESTNDYAIGLKLSRLTIFIIQNCNICYDLITYLLKYY